MLSQNFSETSSAGQWDHPLLQPYVDRESELEDYTGSDDTEVDNEIVAIWREALRDHPELAGSYLRLAAALRDCTLHAAAAEVLRSGIERGHEQLWLDLLQDYPELLSEDELELAIAEPRLQKEAFAAMLRQRRTDLALEALGPLLDQRKHHEQDWPRFESELTKLVGLLIENGRLQEAAELVVHLTPSKQSTLLVRELLKAESWSNHALLAGLAQLEAGRGIRGLWHALSDLGRRDRRAFFANLREKCPVLLRKHRTVFSRMERHLTRRRWMPVAAAIVAAATSLVWLLAHAS